MKIILIFIIFVLVFFIGKDFFLSKTHITKIIVNKPYDETWKWLSEPLNYDKLYPKWISKIEKVDNNKYLVTSPYEKKEYEIESLINKESGAIDFIIGEEKSRTRIISLDDKKTAVIHFGYKWKNFNYILWLMYKLDVNSDFNNAKKIIERKG